MNAFREEAIADRKVEEY